MDRANLGLVALNVSDELGLSGTSPRAGHGCLHLKSESSIFALVWKESHSLDDISIGDGLH